ncbi:ABC transporter ATP-binding protein [Enterococcus sp. AZ109]|uniref:ABC transporter ATP-binding protein n=1 Tax=Enterococcus sp. AZ109 TaxID=2774634 RepID=UPI003F227990
MKPLIKVTQLTKAYDKKEVLHGITFEIKQGEILCLLGPNGAAKSTTINMLCGSLSFDQGEILYKGQSIKQLKKAFKAELGMVPQDIAIYEDLSAEQNVRFFASLYGLKGAALKEGINFALESVGLLEHRKEKARTFSGGMKRRLNIACAIAHHPTLLIMDEPTVGIDPQSRNHILQSIRKMQAGGMTILYTTHYMEEVEEISTRIIIMDHGSIIAEGTKEELKGKNQERKILVELEAPHTQTFDEFYQIEGIKDISLSQNDLTITAIKGIENLDHIIQSLLQRKEKIQNIAIQTDNLETVFLDLTGRSLRD